MRSKPKPAPGSPRDVNPSDWMEAARALAGTARPPELIALAAVPLGSEDSAPAIVYPEPMMSADEERLFRAISPRIRMQTLTDWLEERR